MVVRSAVSFFLGGGVSQMTHGLIRRELTTKVFSDHLWEDFRMRQPLNPFFALDIFICSFRKCIQHTTRGQSNFPLSKLCCYIFIVLKYWWQNSITAHIYANCDQGIVTR